jgi:serine/threonine-protein kinase
MPIAVEQGRCSQCGQGLGVAARFCDRCGTPVQAPGAQAVEHRPLRVGDVLEGKWRLEGKLGAGGMGAVFLARDVALDRRVAVKILSVDLCEDPEFVTRFEREARMTARLEHPNIVPVHAVGRHRGRPFIVMKALEGVTLSRLLKTRSADGRRLTRGEILPLFKQLCAGLAFIHSKGYVHRDVKAGNVFLGDDGRVTLLDFGVLRDLTAQHITRSGVLLGTPHYLSPEQARGETELDGRSDLYAVGVLLFECITLRPPFTGDPLTLLRQHVEAPPPDVAALAPGLPAGVAAVVRKALQKKPKDRFADASQLWAALEEAWPEQEAASTLAPELVTTLPGLSIAAPNLKATLVERRMPARSAPTSALVAAPTLPAPGSESVTDPGHIVTEASNESPQARKTDEWAELVTTGQFRRRIRPRWPYAAAALLLTALATLVTWLVLRR